MAVKGNYHQMHVRCSSLSLFLGVNRDICRGFELEGEMHNVLIEVIFEMQIMIYWDNMPSSLNTQPYHLLRIHVLILLTLDPFIPHPRTPVEVFQIIPILTIPGMFHQYTVRCQLHILSRPWISIITVGISIPLPSRHPVIELQAVIKLQFHMSLKGHQGPVLMYPDQGLLCIHSLLVTGMYLYVFLVGSWTVS